MRYYFIPPVGDYYCQTHELKNVSEVAIGQDAKVEKLGCLSSKDLSDTYYLRNY